MLMFGVGAGYADATTFADSVLYSFCSQGGAQCIDGALPFAGMVQAHDGNFYGTTGAGGSNDVINHVSIGDGVVFKLTPAGVETVLYSFCGPERDVRARTGLSPQC